MIIDTSLEEWMKKTKTVLRRESTFREMPCLVEDFDSDYERKEFYPVPLITTLSSNQFPGVLKQIEYFTLQSFIYYVHIDKIILHFSMNDIEFKLVAQFLHDDCKTSTICYGDHTVLFPVAVKLIQYEIEQFIRDYSPNRLFMTTKTYVSDFSYLK